MKTHSGFLAAIKSESMWRPGVIAVAGTSARVGHVTDCLLRSPYAAADKAQHNYLNGAFFSSH
jgi:hypothetical protein